MSKYDPKTGAVLEQVTFEPGSCDPHGLVSPKALSSAAMPGSIRAGRIKMVPASAGSSVLSLRDGDDAKFSAITATIAFRAISMSGRLWHNRFVRRWRVVPVAF